MEKIPTVFQRSADRRSLTRDVTPGCEWVLAGDGIAHRKIDGTCVRIRRDGLAIAGYARRIVRPGKKTPAGFQRIVEDPATGNVVGWEPIENTGFRKLFDEAVANHERGGGEPLMSDTYELVGPKINGNREQLDEHRLIRHSSTETIDNPIPVTYETLYLLFDDLAEAGWEGIVWWHPDGVRRAKLKVRDFR